MCVQYNIGHISLACQLPNSRRLDAAAAALPAMLWLLIADLCPTHVLQICPELAVSGLVADQPFSCCLQQRGSSNGCY